MATIGFIGGGNMAEALIKGIIAAKEAVLKLLGTGWRGKIKWTDIEVVNNSYGQPKVKLYGQVKESPPK